MEITKTVTRQAKIGVDNGDYAEVRQDFEGGVQIALLGDLHLRILTPTDARRIAAALESAAELAVEWSTEAEEGVEIDVTKPRCRILRALIGKNGVMEALTHTCDLDDGHVGKHSWEK